MSPLGRYGGARAIASASRNCSVLFLRTITSAASQEQLSGQDKYEAAKPFNQIPGPKSYPLLKSLPFFSKHFAANPDNINKIFGHMKEEFGPIVRFEAPLKLPAVLIYDPNTVQEVIKEGVSNQPIRDGMKYLHVYRTQTRRDWFQGSGGILTEQGEKWYRIRSKVQQPLMRPKTAVQYLKPMNEVAEDFVQHIKRIRSKDNNQVPDDFINDLYKWGLESVALIALNTRMGCFSPDISADSDAQVMITSVNKSLEGMMALEMAPPIWEFFATKPWKQFVKATDKMCEIGFKYINKAAEGLEKKLSEEDPELSVLEKFLTTPGLKKGDAYNMAMDMLFAGIDTTGNSMGYFLYLVATYPEVQKKLQREVDAVLPGKDKSLSPEDMNRLPYLKAAIKESMRMYPITMAWGRVLDHNIAVEGYQLPKGTNVIFPFQLTSESAEQFPRPEEFRPERWLRGNEEQQSHHSLASLPFGYGVRMCIGRRIAEQELYVLAAKILRNYWTEYNGDMMKVTTRLLNVPGVPLRFQFVDRN